MCEQEYVNNKQAAKILGISEHTMKKIRNSEGFEFTRLGREIKINKAFLLEYMKTHRKIKY